MKKSENRERARCNGELTYQGRACAKCNGTTRYTSGCGCVVCQNQRVKDHGAEASYRYNKSDKGKATREKYQETEKYVEGYKRINKRQYKRKPDYFKNSDLRSKYGITLSEFNEMLDKQNGVCYICERPDPSGRRLAVDHNHNTGQIRKLLCGPCNKALGLLKENKVFMQNMINYVDEHT